MAEGGIICNADKKVLFASKVTMFINNLYGWGCFNNFM